LYFIESHLAGEPIAERMVPGLRRSRPDALIVVVGSGLEARFANGLVEAGRVVVWDRAVLGDALRVLAEVRNFIERRRGDSAGDHQFKLAS
jgi:hypothetical protein